MTGTRPAVVRTYPAVAGAEARRATAALFAEIRPALGEFTPTVTAKMVRIRALVRRAMSE
jgi:hypothetical protein